MARHGKQHWMPTLDSDAMREAQRRLWAQMTAGDA
jgi:hypothetical protein